MRLSNLLNLLKDEVLVFIHIAKTDEIKQWGTVKIVMDLLKRDDSDGIIDKYEIGRNSVTIYLKKLED
jgi:hypothetical protein